MGNEAVDTCLLCWYFISYLTNVLKLQEKSKAVVVLQRAVKDFLKRKHALRRQTAALVLQRVWRGHAARKVARQHRLELALQQKLSAVLLLQVWE